MSVKHLYCQQSERSFVGCVVSGEGMPLDHFPVTPEHFFDGTARAVFERAQALFSDGKPVNLRTVMTAFAGQPEGVQNLVSDICFYPVPAQAGHFFELINDKLILRRANQAMKWAEEEIRITDDAKVFSTEFQAIVASLDSNASSENVLDEVCDSIDEKLAKMERGEIVRGIPMKIAPWDNSFGGLMPGQLYGLAGRPGTGKTALLEMLIQQCIETGNPAVVFEKDMSPQKLVERMACRATGVQFSRFARGGLHDWELRNVRKGVKYFRESPLFLYNPTGLTADRLCQIARRDIRVHGAKAVFLDHIQALKVGSELREGLTSASLAIRANVTETNVPHVVLAHINRTGAKGRPSPEDIKEFDQLYGDCDGMMILWTDKSQVPKGDGAFTTTNFYIAKNRDGGVSEDEMWFDGPHMTFKEKSDAPEPRR